MAILTKGQTFADSDSITSTKLNNLVDNAAFVAGASGSTDNTSLEVNGSGKLQVKDSGVTSTKLASSAVTTAKIASSSSATNGVTFSKLQYVADMRVIGNVSGGLTVPSEVSILDEDDMVSNSATALATQQSIKAYVDSAPNFIPATYSGGESSSFPNGLVMKFGTVSATANAITTVTFEEAFTTECVSAQLTIRDPGSADRQPIKIDSHSATTVVIRNTGSSTLNIDWFAIGY